METTESKITSKGQISIPSKVRKKLGLKPGSKILWREHGNDFVVTKAANYSSKDIHEAVFKTTPGTVGIAEMDVGIADLMKKKHARD